MIFIRKYQFIYISLSQLTISLVMSGICQLLNLIGHLYINL